MPQFYPTRTAAYIFLILLSVQRGWAADSPPGSSPFLPEVSLADEPKSGGSPAAAKPADSPKPAAPQTNPANNANSAAQSSPNSQADSQANSQSNENKSAESFGQGSLGNNEASSGASFSANMIGDSRGGPGIQAIFIPPPKLGPIQFGQFTFGLKDPNGGTGPFPPSSVTNGTVTFTTPPFTISNVTLPTQTFVGKNSPNSANIKQLPLTNSNPAYATNLQQALFTLQSAKNNAQQTLSSVTVSPAYAVNQENSPIRYPVQSGDLFFVVQPYQYQFLLTQEPIEINLPSPSGGMLGRQRIADNDSPMPTDRVFFDYSYFQDAVGVTSSDASRFIPGFEKTFLGGMASFEMRIPMGVQESNNIAADQSSFSSTGQFGDIEMIVKMLLVEEENWAFSVGLAVSVPTGPSSNVSLSDGTPLARITNQSTHLQPFFGLMLKPNDNWFIESFLGVDVAANGDPVSVNLTGSGLVPVGNFYDQTLIFADASIGRWLYRNKAKTFSALAAVIEAHYTGAISDPTPVQTGGFVIGGNQSFNDLDLTIGAHAVIGNMTTTLGYAVPVTSDRGFDGELRFFLNRKF